MNTSTEPFDLSDKQVLRHASSGRKESGMPKLERDAERSIHDCQPWKEGKHEYNYHHEG